MTEIDEFNEDFLLTCAHILMGAAYADGSFDDLEEDAIINIMMQVTGEEDYEDEIFEVIEEFDEEEFNLEVLAEPLLDEPEELRLLLMKMVAILREANGVIELEEDDYLMRLAEVLDLEAEFMDDYATEAGFEPDESLLDSEYDDQK